MIIFQEKYSSQDCILKCRDLDPRNWKNLVVAKLCFISKAVQSFPLLPKFGKLLNLGEFRKLQDKFWRNSYLGIALVQGLKPLSPDHDLETESAKGPFQWKFRKKSKFESFYWMCFPIVSVFMH